MRSHQRIPLDTVIQKLIENNPNFTELKLSSILINPRPRHDLFDHTLVSHIRDEDLRRLAEALKQNTTLQSVILDGYFDRLDFTSAGSEAIGDALKTHPKLNDIVIGKGFFRETSPNATLGFLNCMRGTAKIEKLSLYHIFSINNELVEQLNRIGRCLLNSHLTSIEIFNKDTDTIPHIFSTHSLNDFTSALARQKNLEAIALTSLGLGNNLFQQITDSLVPVSDEEKSTTSKLKIIYFESCSLRNSGISIKRLVENSPLLEELSLCDDYFSVSSIECLSNALPGLQNLRYLNVSGAGLSYSTLAKLTSTLRSHNLPISELDLSSNPICRIDPNLELILNFLRQNLKIKKINLSCTGIREEHTDILANFLRNPAECFLEECIFTREATFSDSDEKAFIKKILDVYKSNERLCKVGLIKQQYRGYVELYDASQVNIYKKYLRTLHEWNRFLSIAICLFNASYISDQNINLNLKKIPIEHLKLVLSFLNPVTSCESRDNAEEYIHYIERLMRPTEIGNGECEEQKIPSQVIPPAGLLRLRSSSNYSKEIKVASSVFLLFAHNPFVESDFKSLSEIIKMISPYVYRAYTPKGPNNDYKIYIDIAHYDFTPMMQKHLKETFVRFLWMHRKCNFSAVMPNVVIEDGILKISGIRLDNLLAMVKSKQSPIQIVHDSVAAKCSVM